MAAVWSHWAQIGISREIRQMLIWGAVRAHCEGFPLCSYFFMCTRITLLSDIPSAHTLPSDMTNTDAARILTKLYISSRKEHLWEGNWFAKLPDTRSLISPHNQTIHLYTLWGHSEIQTWMKPRTTGFIRSSENSADSQAPSKIISRWTQSSYVGVLFQRLGQSNGMLSSYKPVSQGYLHECQWSHCTDVETELQRTSIPCQTARKGGRDF